MLYASTSNVSISLSISIQLHLLSLQFLVLQLSVLHSQVDSYSSNIFPSDNGFSLISQTKPLIFFKLYNCFGFTFSFIDSHNNLLHEAVHSDAEQQLPSCFNESVSNTFTADIATAGFQGYKLSRGIVPSCTVLK